jgi:Fic family protein
MYDIAQKLGLETREVIAKAKALGISAAKVPSSSLDKITAEYLIEQLRQPSETTAGVQPTPRGATINSVRPSRSGRDFLIKTGLPNTAAEKDLEGTFDQTGKRPKVSEPWQPIDDLPVDWQKLVNPSIQNQTKAWLEQAAQLKNKESYEAFLVRLRREWAIETGILERLYTLTEGATKTLIEKGLDAAYLSHSDTDQRPEDVIAMIHDQEEAINAVEQFVTGKVPLTVGFIRHLHTILTRHQQTYEAENALGQTIHPVLKQGEWKELPNSLGGPDGVQFAPPVQVDSEMERLITLHLNHDAMGVSPDVEAAWLHHCFTLIHPFVDGNGRVARCLATLVFLRANWFPLVITRADREPYISALRMADSGDLKPLIDFFGSLQSKAIRQALSLGEETHVAATKLKGVLASAREKIRDLKTEQEKLKQQLITTADALHENVVQRLKHVQREIETELDREDVPIDVRVQSAQRDDTKADYHSIQIIQCAKAQHYFANRGVYQAWALLKLSGKRPVEILFSFHGVGKSTNMLACAAMVYSRFVTDKGVSQVGDLLPLTDEPFQFTYNENPTAVLKRFGIWLEDRIVDGLNYWQKSIEI